MKKWVLPILLAVSLLGNVLLVINTLDLGVTITHSEDQESFRRQQLLAIEKLLPKMSTGSSADEIVRFARELGLDVGDATGPDISVNDIQFIFSENRLSTVHFY